jgi:hypothetical protein
MGLTASETARQLVAAGGMGNGTAHPKSVSHFSTMARYKIFKQIFSLDST